MSNTHYKSQIKQPFYSLSKASLESWKTMAISNLIVSKLNVFFGKKKEKENTTVCNKCPWWPLQFIFDPLKVTLTLNKEL